MSSTPHINVRTLRRRSSLAQKDLAFLLGSKSRAVVSRFEQGQRIPSLRTALALAAILNTTIGNLYRGLQREANTTVAPRIEELRNILAKKCSGRKRRMVERQIGWLESHPLRVGNGHQRA